MQTLNCFVTFAACFVINMNKDFEVLESVIKYRRTVKPAKMNGEPISEESIHQLLQLADWAPTHGRTEPWRFIVFEGAALKYFSEQHAALYRKHCPPEKFKEQKFEKIINNGQSASHLVVVVMKRTENSKIKEREEYAAVAAAVQNILLGAAALKLAAMWSTGGLATEPEMKGMLQLNQEDSIVGFLYLGYTDQEQHEGVRRIPLIEKIIWNK